jgi:hypothetical protein
MSDSQGGVSAASTKKAQLAHRKREQVAPFNGKKLCGLLG